MVVRAKGSWKEVYSINVLLLHGEASKEDLASEIKDALNALMQLTIYYHVEDEVAQSVEKAIQRLTEEGCIIQEGM